MPALTVNGISLYYEVHGSADAPVLVLNNGILMNAASSWVYQTKALSSHYRLIQYDCRGQGQSDHPQEAYSMEQHAADLAGLLDGLGIGRAHIAGISYGGEVAQAFALLYPQRVSSLILADTVSEVGPELRLIVEGWRHACLANDALGLFLSSVAWNFSPGFIANNAQLIAGARERYAKLDLAAVARLCDAFLNLDFTARLPEIHAPTCVIVGEADLLKGRAYAEIIQRGIAGSELHIIPEAGHASCWESPEVFNAIVLGFLAKQAR